MNLEIIAYLHAVEKSVQKLMTEHKTYVHFRLGGKKESIVQQQACKFVLVKKKKRMARKNRI